MNIINNHWKSLFLFCLGLTVGTAFCMKWLETEFLLNDGKFTMIGLEISYSKEKVAAIMAAIDDHSRSALKYQLYFDFAFMAGVYPSIAALCMMARQKIVSPSFRKIIFAIALMQTFAWIADIIENLFLLKWLSPPVEVSDFGLYHFIVYAKWLIALTGFFIAVLVLVFNRKIK